MKFSLLFYTDGWDVGPTVELDRVPSPGSVVWTKGRKDNGDNTDMYYVDNVMYAERGLDSDEVVYLYVRPYVGYTRYAPMTESDRLTAKLERIIEELDIIRKERAAQLEDAKKELAEANLRLRAIGEQLALLAGNIDDRQQEIGNRLDDISFALQTING